MSTRSVMARRSPQKVGIEDRVDAAGRQQHRGWVWDSVAGKKVRGPWQYTLAAARSWRIDAMARMASGSLSAEKGPRLKIATDVFLDGVQDGSILNRSRKPYKPSAYRGLRTSLRRMVTTFGDGMLLDEFELTRLQRFVDERSRLAAPQTVCNDINALRALFAWARRRERTLHGLDPFHGLLLPRGETPRERIAPPAELGLLVAALASDDRALLAVAGLAGLRRGEALALAREHIDLDARLIHVRRGWDPGAGEFVAPKTPKAFRSVPIVERLNVVLEDHLAQLDGDLLFPGRRGAGAQDRPMSETAFAKRARERWRKLNLMPLGLHEARHTFASIAIASNVNAKALSTYMGHSSIQITFDRYGHLMPGNEEEALRLMDAYLGGDHDR
jgi:integrase